MTTLCRRVLSTLQLGAPIILPTTRARVCVCVRARVHACVHVSVVHFTFTAKDMKAQKGQVTCLRSHSSSSLQSPCSIQPPSACSPPPNSFFFFLIITVKYAYQKLDRVRWTFTTIPLQDPSSSPTGTTPVQQSSPISRQSPLFVSL